MRYILCIVSFLLCGGSIQAQPEVVLFDGKTSSGWVIDGDAAVKDGVLILGGNQKTWVRIGADFSPEFELHLEYSTENEKPIQIESHSRDFLGQGIRSSGLDRRSKKAGEWIEAILVGKENPGGNEWEINSKWRVMGEAAFTVQPLGGSGSLPSSAFIAFEIPAGQKLYLRNVRVKTEPAASSLWLLIIVAGAVMVVLLVIAVAAWAIVKKRRTPTQVNVQPDKAYRS